MPGPLLPTLAAVWAGWAHWILEHRDLLETWSIFVDQAAMTLTLAEAGIRPAHSAWSGTSRPTIQGGTLRARPSRPRSTTRPT